jgi:hypothetical protein
MITSNNPGGSSKCVLCGAATATTREHVPPESFFEAPYPDNLITVPSCEDCNLGTQRDDEYLLTYLVSLDYPGGSATLERVRDRQRRAIHRPGYGGLRQRLVDASEITRATDSTGSLVDQLRTKPEGDRILKVIRKQTRGLAHFLTGQIFPSSTFIRAERIYGNAVVPTADVELWAAVAAEAMTGAVGSRGDVFRYAYKSVARSACSAVVMLEFWQAYGYAAMIFQPGFSPPQRVALPFLKAH